MRINSKGQVTIPRRIREALGLHPNTEVDHAIDRGTAVIRPKTHKLTIGELTVRRIKQGPKMNKSSAELLALLRDERDIIDV